jgi:hypothetical protein
MADHEQRAYEPHPKIKKKKLSQLGRVFGRVILAILGLLSWKHGHFAYK